MKAFRVCVLGLFLACLSLVYANEAIVTVNSLNVRDVPNGKKVDQLKQNQSVLIIDTKETWSHIAYEGKQGWVSSSFLTLKDPNALQATNTPEPKLDGLTLKTSCQTQEDSKAKVCLKHAPASLVCNGSTCEVVFLFNISTNYKGEGFLYADLDFQAALRFPDGTVQERLEQTGYSFYKDKDQNDELRIAFTIPRGTTIDQLKLQEAKAKITQISYYR